MRLFSRVLVYVVEEPHNAGEFERERRAVGVVYPIGPVGLGMSEELSEQFMDRA